MSITLHGLSIGDKIHIVRDIRDGSPATGQVAIFEGDFPLTVALKNGDEWVKEIDYEIYQSRQDVRITYPLWKGETETPPWPRFAMPMDNPRFVLSDGSKIWGAECWWEEYQDSRTHEEMEADLNDHIAFYRWLLTQEHP